MDGVQVRTLSDGGQEAADVARQIAAFLAAAERSLDLALYDFHLPPELDEIVSGALVAAAGRGVAVRLAYNVDRPGRTPVPAPPKTQPSHLEALPFPTAGIPGVPDLMHHKYVIRDGASLLGGSTNWTADSWTREENVIVTLDSAAVAARYQADFDELWQTREVARTGKVDTAPIGPIRTWFCPGRGERLAHRIAKACGSAQRRIRIASPVLSSAPILATLAQVATDGKVDLAGVVDETQVEEVVRQWRENGNVEWKAPLLRTVLTRAPFSGKRSTPWSPQSVHDYMHAKLTVADDTVFVGSFNLSHSGEQNAEDVLELQDAELADRLAAFVDDTRRRYPPIGLWTGSPDRVIVSGHGRGGAGGTPQKGDL